MKGFNSFGLCLALVMLAVACLVCPSESQAAGGFGRNRGAVVVNVGGNGGASVRSFNSGGFRGFGNNGRVVVNNFGGHGGNFQSQGFRVQSFGGGHSCGNGFGVQSFSGFGNGVIFVR